MVSAVLNRTELESEAFNVLDGDVCGIWGTSELCWDSAERLSLPDETTGHASVESLRKASLCFLTAVVPFSSSPPLSLMSTVLEVAVWVKLFCAKLFASSKSLWVDADEDDVNCSRCFRMSPQWMPHLGHLKYSENLARFLRSSGV